MTPVIAAAFGLLSLALPARRGATVLAGGVLFALAQASLLLAGGPNWRGAGLPTSYLSVTAALLAGGTLCALITALRGVARAEVRAPAPVVTLMTALLAALSGWVLVPVALAAGLVRTLLILLVLTLTLVLLGSAGRTLGEALRRRRMDSSLSAGIKPGSSPRLDRSGASLLSIHLALAVLALGSPHLVLLLAAVFGSCGTGLLLERRVDSTRRWPWPVIAGLALLLLVSGFTIRIAGEVPLALAELREGPFSPAFEPAAALGFLIAAWPLLRLWPFQGCEAGPFTPLAGAALLVRVAGPILAAGTEHWQPLVFPLLVFVTLWGALAGALPLSIRAVATAGLASLYPQAVWAGVVLLGGEGTLSSVRRFASASAVRLVTPGLVLVLMVSLAPIFLGGLRAETFYSVLIGAGLALALRLDTSFDPGLSAR